MAWSPFLAVNLTAKLARLVLGEDDVKITFNACRLLLCEVGYQAGQHELLSESLGK